MHILMPQIEKTAADIVVRRGACAWGELWLAQTGLGICQLEFVIDGETRAAERSLISHWPGSRVVMCPDPIDVEALFRTSCRLHVQGTAFQHRVWAALLDIPRGQTRSYGEIAAAIGQPAAFRAVGAAVGRNPVAMLIPCHRVLAANRRLGGFYWGPALKRSLLADEGVVV